MAARDEEQTEAPGDDAGASEDGARQSVTTSDEEDRKSGSGQTEAGADQPEGQAPAGGAVFDFSSGAMTLEKDTPAEEADTDVAPDAAENAAADTDSKSGGQKLAFAMNELTPEFADEKPEDGPSDEETAKPAVMDFSSAQKLPHKGTETPPSSDAVSDDPPPAWMTSEPEAGKKKSLNKLFGTSGKEETGKTEQPAKPAAAAKKAAATQAAPPAQDKPRGDGLLDPVPQAKDPDAGSGERDLLGGAANGAVADLEQARVSRAAFSAASDLPEVDAAPALSGGGPAGEGDDKGQDATKHDGPGWQVKPLLSTPDDPLLGCLTVLCTLLDRPISADALTAGLPLHDGHLTPDLFVSAAQRAGISARMMKKNLSTITKFSLPCVLLLSNKRAAILTDVQLGQTATVILPEMGSGSQTISYKDLEAEYEGYALFARPEFQYDDRAQERRIADPKGWFWGTIFTSWKLYVEVMVAAMLINMFAIAAPLFTMNVYDRVVPNNAQETLWVLAIGVGIVFLFDFLLKLIRGYLVDAAGKTADTRIAARLFQQMMGMKMAHRPPSAGGLANSMREFESLREFFTSSTLVALIDLPFIFLFLAIIRVISGSWIVVAVPFSVIVVVAVVGLILQMPMRRVIEETQKESQQKHAILIEAISGIETIKSTASEGRMQRAWEVFVDKTARSATKAARWSQLAMNFSSLAMQFVTVGVIVVGVSLIQEGEMTVGALVACTILSGRALAPLGQIAAIANRFHQARQSLIQLDMMMKTPVERPQGRSFVHRPNLAGHIEFKEVFFAYPGAKTEALTDVSFNIEPGEKVGIVGRIGSGKSTLERLILGLHEPEKGGVLVDGTDTRQIDPADLRRNIGVVPQDVYLFYGSVKENIALGAPYADDASILRAARIAGVDEFTSKHPLGLDLPVGERGMSLSGGQRQAVAIARALLLDPPMLVFDEPTSAMDNTTESRFKARLNTVLSNKTMILVTHRGSLLNLVDRLIVMDGGRVVADGPKDSVMEALTSGRIHTAKV